MKRWLGVALRIAIAAIGVGFIVWSLTWTDHVRIPDGYEFPNGQVVAGEQFLQIQAEDASRLWVDPVSMGDEGRWIPYDGHWEPGEPKLEPGVLTTLAAADWSMVLFGLVLLGALFPIQAFRWFMLMRCRGIQVTPVKAMRLTMVGQFFNICMPGTTGGDLMKAYYVAKGSGQRTTAVMSVVFDRITGLLALVLLAGLVGLFMLDVAITRYITVGVWIGLGAGAAVGMVLASKRLRQKLGIALLLRKLPAARKLQKIDAAAFAYRDHKVVILMTVAVSLVGHIAQTCATAAAGYGLGLEADLFLLMTVLPIIFLAAAVPLTYQGLGVMEGLALVLIATPGVDENAVVGMLLILRLYLIFYALLGSVVMLRGDIHLHPQEEAAMADEAVNEVEHEAADEEPAISPAPAAPEAS